MLVCTTSTTRQVASARAPLVVDSTRVAGCWVCEHGVRRSVYVCVRVCVCANVSSRVSQDPLLVPVKILKAHKVTKDDLGALDCVFHPTQPWVFTAGADGVVSLFQNIP
jgi:hypothetical protein